MNTTCNDSMDRLKVTNLKAIAKSNGLCDYYKLRKAELIDFLTREGVTLERLRAIDLKAIAKSKGLHGYYKLRKAELIDLLTPTGVRSKPKVNFVEKPEIIFVDEAEEEEEAKKRKREVERRKHVAKMRWHNIRMLRKLKKLRSSHAFKLVKTNSAFNGFAKHYKIVEVADDGRRVFVSDFKNVYEPKAVYGPKVFLSVVKPTILTFLRDSPGTKIILVLHCIMARYELPTGRIRQYVDAYFTSDVKINFQGTDVDDLYNTMTHKMLEKMAEFQSNASDWMFHSIKGLYLHTVEYEPLSGSSYIELPKALADKKAIINMKNKDNECFKWCITRALNLVDKHPERITKILQLQAEKLNWKDLKFPMELKDISRFEKLNEISINVYGYEKLNGVYPLKISNAQHYSHHVNLLLISEGEKKHYCLIKSMSRLLASQVTTKKAKKFFCPRCLNAFGRQDLLDKHLELCRDNSAMKIKMPEKGTLLYFKNNHKKMDVPFVIYADFESLMKAIQYAQRRANSKKSYTDQVMAHKPVSFSYYVKCTFDDSKSKAVEYTATSEDEDVAQIFVNMLEQEVKSIYKDHPQKQMIFTKIENVKYKKYKRCWICDKGFTEKDPKVRDHDHYTGKFRGAAHNSCNLKFRRPKFTPVIFHNLAGYDAHLFIKNLGVSEGNIDCIPNNEEKYISFTKHIEVDRFIQRDGENNKVVVVKRELRFIDSFKFMSYSLDTLVNNLDEKDFVNTSKFYTGEQLQLLKRKGVYPYEWLDSIDKLNETRLPPKKAFFSKLNGEGISDKDYEHAQKVWKTFDMKTMRDYHNLYNKTDVLLLADVFENFRKVCKKNYDLDPCWYYTAPGLSWDACLKLTKIKLELLTDPDMLLMFEKGIRGGISMISTRHGKANNKYMGERFDINKLVKYIIYLDANNLYGYAMCKKLPTGGFKWMTEEELKRALIKQKKKVTVDETLVF